MEKFPYILNVSCINKFLKKIQSTGVPSKVNVDYLKALGFRSSNHRALVPMIKALGFVSSDGLPTERWKKYRDRTVAKQAMAEGIMECYSDLFKIYPDAHLKDTETLVNFFKSKTSVGDRAVTAMVQTFRTLVQTAEFLSIDKQVNQEQQTISNMSAPRLESSGWDTRQALVININIQLTLPETSNVDTYDAIFAAMKKHFYNK